jgi:hypothetical protein
MADENDNGQDPTLELAPIRRGPGRPPKVAEPANNVATSLAKVLAQAIGEVGAREPEVRLPDDAREVKLKANKAFHVAAEHLARSQIEGSVYGMDGMGLQLEPHQSFVVRPGPWVDYLIESGLARHDRNAP